MSILVSLQSHCCDTSEIVKDGDLLRFIAHERWGEEVRRLDNDCRSLADEAADIDRTRQEEHVIQDGGRRPLLTRWFGV